MTERNEVISEMMKDINVRNLGLKDEAINKILESYDKIVINSLLENGYIELSNGMYVEIIKLTDRVHVLRGVSYSSHRKYKLKVTMREDLYKSVEDYYDRLLEDIT